MPRKPIVFPYKEVYKHFPCPVVKVQLGCRGTWVETEAYVDSGASVSLFSLIESQRLGIDHRKGKKIFSVVGDGSLIPVFLHRINARIGESSFKANVGFSPKLGVGFNLLGRQDIFRVFDITFSDTSRTITFHPRR